MKVPCVLCPRASILMYNVGPVGALTGKWSAAGPMNLICSYHMDYIFIAAVGQLGAIRVIHRYNILIYTTS